MKKSVAILALLIVVLAGCNLDVGKKEKATTTPNPTVNLTPNPIPNPTTVNPTANATSAATVGSASGEVKIFLIAQQDNGASGPLVGCGDSAVPVTQNMALPSDIEGSITAALSQLFSIKDQNYGQSGLYNALYQSNLSVQSVSVDASGHATVNLTGNYQMGGECDSPRFQAQIEQTILQFPQVTDVSVLIDGKALEDIVSGRG